MQSYQKYKNHDKIIKHNILYINTLDLSFFSRRGRGRFSTRFASFLVEERVLSLREPSRYSELFTAVTKDKKSRPVYCNKKYI